MDPLPVLVNGQAVFVLWESNDDGHDRVFARGMQVERFPTLEALEGFARERGIVVEDAGELEAVDIDAAQAWVVGGPMPSLAVLLNVWNLAGDVARGTNQKWADRGEDLDRVYDLLFFGTNLPAMTPLGEQLTPDWSDFDLVMLRGIVDRGVLLIRRAMGVPASVER